MVGPPQVSAKGGGHPYGQFGGGGQPSKSFFFFFHIYIYLLKGICVAILMVPT
jgi:hypothetical protein